MINKVDSNILINCGVIAMKAKEMDAAKKYFKKAADLKVGGVALYIDIYRIYIEAGDTTGAINTLKEGIDKYPTKAGMVIAEMVNLYLKTGKDKEAIDYLNKAIALEPNNPVYYFAMGTLYGNLKQIDKSMESYEKAVKIDPNYVDAYLNMGASYYNAGIEHFKLANDAKDNAVYEKEIAIGKSLYEKAVPYLVKVKEISTDKKYKLDALFSLKQIYYKLGQKENKDKAQAEYDALSK
jgi:tetratricopeptide (TPR) repeat protein